jgi:hypothetical protein
MKKPTVAKFYRRALAAANPKLRWAEVPDCPMKVFVRILAERERAHPEQAVPTMEYRARVFSETAWKSEKIDNIKPVEWRAEYAWLYSIAMADGTFEAAPKQIWAAAYAVVRPDWDTGKVIALLDELERVGLLERKTDEHGKVWGRWTGAQQWLPKKEYVKAHRYKTGRSDLFSDGAAPEQPERSASATLAQRQRSAVPEVGLGLGVGSGEDSDSDTGLDAAKNSENEHRPEQSNPNPKSKGVFVPSTPTPAPTATSTPKAKRPVLSRDEYEHEKSRGKTDAQIAEWAAEVAAREPCPNCGAKHPLPACQPKKPIPMAPEQEKQFENQELPIVKVGVTVPCQ